MEIETVSKFNLNVFQIILKVLELEVRQSMNIILKNCNLQTFLRGKILYSYIDN